MLATVRSIESGALWKDGIRRVTLRFADASLAYRDLQIPIDLLPGDPDRDVRLDQEYNVVLQRVIEIK